MATTDTSDIDRRGHPETSSHPDVSRVYARQWWWTRHDREEYHCPDCGRGYERVYRFEVHHIDGEPTNNDPENLVALCQRCHIWRHKSPTLSGLDLEEWQSAFVDGGDESIGDMLVYDQPEGTE